MLEVPEVDRPGAERRGAGHRSHGIGQVHDALLGAGGDQRPRHLNISTVEDPIEAHIPGINQSQVNDRAGFTFAGALRALLRQDPDVIMVGEIRDEETAATATQAALTGHLVFSTLHTNDAASAVTRLIHVGIEPYLVAATLRGVLAQRLVRKICPHCKEQTEVDQFTREMIEGLAGPVAELYAGVGLQPLSRHRLRRSNRRVRTARPG